MMSESEVYQYIKEYSIMELICNGIQVAGGAGLAYYTYKNGTNEVLPFMLSAIAVGGTYNFYKTMEKNLTWIFMDRRWSAWNFSTGALTYSVGLYAFSESLKGHDRMWIPYLALAGSGYWLTTSAIDSLDSALHRSPLLKCCQLMFDPGLNASMATYLFHFQKHSSGWLKCLPFFLTAANGFNVADRGNIRQASRRDKILLKGVEMLMGGSIASISCAGLAIYSSRCEGKWPLSGLAAIGCIYGAMLAFDSLPFFRILVNMEPLEYDCVCDMIGGTVVYLSACAGVKCISNPRDPVMLPLFIVTAGVGLDLARKGLLRLRRHVPFPVFRRYCQRVLGPITMVHGSLFAGYFGYHMGYRFSLAMVPFIMVGMSATCAGYRRSNEPQLEP